MVNAKRSYRFTRRERITHSQDFRRVMKTGRKRHSKNFILFVKENGQQFHRLGIVVSKEVGPATCRNRIKRVCREFFRLHKHQIKGAFDIILLAKKESELKNFVDATGELGRVFGV